MPIREITPSEPIGTKRIEVWIPTRFQIICLGTDGSWHFKQPFMYRRKFLKLPVYSIHTTGRSAMKETMIRVWLLNSPILLMSHLHSWGEVPMEYILGWLAEVGIHVRYQDELLDYGCKNGFRDIYIKSSVLEKLYAK
jgi:hypothetical protein